MFWTGIHQRIPQYIKSQTKPNINRGINAFPYISNADLDEDK